LTADFESKRDFRLSNNDHGVPEATGFLLRRESGNESGLQQQCGHQSRGPEN
jgi:hypothetical protein